MNRSGELSEEILKLTKDDSELPDLCLACLNVSQSFLKAAGLDMDGKIVKELIDPISMPSLKEDKELYRILMELFK